MYKYKFVKISLFSALYEELAPTPPPYTEATFIETGTDCFTEQVIFVFLFVFVFEFVFVFVFVFGNLADPGNISCRR